MKILSLRALNINTLKGKTHINFRNFTKDKTLFAIRGPGGTGKSTMFDIISCALYGRTLKFRNPNNLMSKNYAEAYCEVEFETSGKVYRSSWKQQRAFKQYDGVFQIARMELTDVEKNQVFSLKSMEVPRKIEELLGLDFNCFTKYVMDT